MRQAFLLEMFGVALFFAHFAIRAENKTRDRERDEQHEHSNEQ